jgi:cytochrome c553
VRTSAIVMLALCASASAHEEEFIPPSPFALGGRALGGAVPGAETPAYLSSSRITAVGDGALVIDEDSGMLIRTDAAGAKLAEVAIGRGAGLLAYDPIARLAYVADRRADRVVVVDERLAIVRSWKTPAEPYAVALTPDRAVALVTSIADRTLVAYDAANGGERWRVALGAEPRGLAMSPDGSRALVASLATGGIDEIELASHDVKRVALTLDAQFARGAYAVAFMGDHLAAAPFQRSVPSSSFAVSTGSYGGSFFPPIGHQLAFIGGDRVSGAEIAVHQPRAVAWDERRDVLYVGGMGSQEILQLTHASQIDVAFRASLPIGGEQCGVDGIAIASNGNVLAWCSFTRSIAVLDAVDRKGGLATHVAVTRGPELARSVLDDTQHLGMVLFQTADPNISRFGGVACANCHLDGRSDGLSWQIHHQRLQTPMLAGRIAGTAPYKWDGTAADLRSSLISTVERLGGDGLSKRHLAALQAYLEAMPPVRSPTLEPRTIARGKQLFESPEVGCTNCHAGAKYTDGARYQFGTKFSFDTPSLIGLAASAPYFHDGSAPTLAALLRDRGLVHGMTDTTRALTDAQIADLTAFLESL